MSIANKGSKMVIDKIKIKFYFCGKSKKSREVV
jgi:hypothetical protein